MKPVYHFLPLDGEALVGRYTEQEYKTKKDNIVPKHEVTIIYDVSTSITTPVLCELRNAAGEVRGYAFRTFED